MSSDAERAAAEKTEADKKAAEDASAAATAAAASAWPTGGYTAFIPLLIISVLAVLASCVDLSTICVVRACLDQYQYVVSSVNAMLVIYLWIKLVEKLPIYSARIMSFCTYSSFSFIQQRVHVNGRPSILWYTTEARAGYI